MRILGRATALLSCALMPVAAHGQDSEELRRYGGIGIGWGTPFGQVGSMTDLVQFASPVAASQLYKPGLVVHLGAGRRVRGWMLEAFLDARIPRLTSAGQAIVDQTHPDSTGQVDVEYASFEVVVGRAVGSHRLSAFGAVGLGLAIMQFSSGASVEPYNDPGVGGSAKVGVDWSPSR